MQCTINATPILHGNNQPTPLTVHEFGSWRHDELDYIPAFNTTSKSTQFRGKASEKQFTVPIIPQKQMKLMFVSDWKLTFDSFECGRIVLLMRLLFVCLCSCKYDGRILQASSSSSSSSSHHHHLWCFSFSPHALAWCCYICGGWGTLFLHASWSGLCCSRIERLMFNAQTTCESCDELWVW